MELAHDVGVMGLQGAVYSALSYVDWKVQNIAEKEIPLPKVFVYVCRNSLFLFLN